MRKKQVNPSRVSTKYRSYTHESLTRAYRAVKDDKVPVGKAARMHCVPTQTLRDRVLGKIDVSTVTTGRATLFRVEEEKKLVCHLKEMASLGYGYTRQEVVNIASDYAIQLGRRQKTDKPLTMNWFVRFVKRWPELRVLKPRALEYQRARSTSAETISKYFDELEAVIDKYDLKEKPYLIFNVDEKGITQNHKPPCVVAGKDFHPLSVTSGKSKTTTVIGCGSAGGMAIPPFFVFAGKRLTPDLMEGATPGAAGMTSETGWSNSEVFRHYCEHHLMKFVPQRQEGEHLLLLLDGHKSHVSVGLLDWAKQKKIVLFVLPAHTSHALQPMDVGCYGPFQRHYHSECHKYMRKTSATVTRYDICRLACKVYVRALSAENLYAVFRRTGIYPLDRDTIPEGVTRPSEVFIDREQTASGDTDDVPSAAVTDAAPTSEPSIFQSKLDQLMTNKQYRPYCFRKTNN